MRKEKLIYAEPEMEMIGLKQFDVIKTSYGDYNATDKDEEYDEINF